MTGKEMATHLQRSNSLANTNKAIASEVMPMDGRIMTVNENELENVTGGGGSKNSQNSAERTVSAHCPHCNKTTTFIVYSGSRGKCKVCGNVSQI